MSAVSEREAFDLYCSHGVLEGCALSQEDFGHFWQSLSREDRRYWADQFRIGPTRLTAEFVSNVGIVEFGQEDDDFLAAARNAARGLTSAD